MDREDDVLENLEVNKSPFPDDFGGLLIPRCIMGGPTDRSELDDTLKNPSLSTD
jgi:hypothetical protein